ncbi:MAG: acyltransferase [Sphingobacteriaceae bacterium]|nr:MAG: acyltransferase [Sphingobacteriaceae bacterium]
MGISNSTIACYDKITIGDNVMIGGSVKIWDTNFHSLNPLIRVSGNDDDIKTAPVEICDYAFIGANSIIMKGVTIGRNSIIAAGSVVVKNIPDNVLAGGNPCKIIKYIN